MAVVEIVIAVAVGAVTVFATGVVVEAVDVDDAEAETVNVAGADTVMVGVHYVVALVEEDHTEGVDSASVTEVVVIGDEAAAVGYVDDAGLVRIHIAHVIVEVRVGSRVGIGIDTSAAVETGFEIQA